ncbi:MAG: endonuclease/exonuclease/phosphatase family protein [Granulosicoccus sp.]|nr:endonuclease/exonuclease/phosphatase family protein [Granulosicoccus sp.]
MKILSWNILHGGGSRVIDIVEGIRQHDPDVVCLQEFRHGKSREPLCAGLKEAGLRHQFTPKVDNARRNTMAVFSRYDFTATVTFEGDEHSARLINLQLNDCPVPALRIIAASFPHKKAQLPVFDHLLSLPADYLATPSLMIGDFNCGIPFEDSETRSFYATHQFQALLRKGWIDSWRSRNPKTREFTWFSTQKGNGFRYDHALTSPVFDQKISRIEYDHALRESGISDHSALLVSL